ncbi:hypothetical protein LZD60_07305 [Clostridium perfringens]|nr:hypothetical protein LZD60_07305 [Clostridium perfringens]
MGRTNISYGAKDILYKLMGQLYKGKPLEILGVNDMPKIMDRLPRNFLKMKFQREGLMKYLF